MDKRIRVGIWGLGRAGRVMHMTELLELPDMFEITAACDLLPRQIELAREKCPDIRYYTNPEEFLKDPEMDLVSVATRSADHVAHALAACRTGRKVVCEKPVSAKAEGIEQLARIEAEHPGTFFIRHNRRFEPAFNQAKKLIATGRLGRVHEIRISRHSFQFRNDWQTLLDQEGGQTLNWGPHIIDQALNFLDYKVKDLWCDLKLVTARGDAEDQIKVILRGLDDLLVDVEISGGVAIPAPIYAIYGTRGALVTYDEKRWQMKYLHPAVPEPVLEPERDLPGGWVKKEEPTWVEDELQVASPENEKMGHIWKHVYRALRENQPYPVTMEQAVAVVRILEKIKKHEIFDWRERQKI